MKNADACLSVFGKDIRRMWKGILAIYLIQGVYTIAIAHYRNAIPLVGPSRFQTFIIMLGNYLFYLYPLFLLVSLIDGRKDEQDFDLVHLMTGKGFTILSKYFIVLLAMLGMMTFLTVRTYMQRHTGRISVDPRIVSHGLIYLFSEPYIALCLVVSSWGAMQIWRRIGTLVAIVVFVFGLIVHHIVMNLDHSLESALKLPYSQWGVGYLLLTIVVGALFCLTGVFLYNRYADI